MCVTGLPASACESLAFLVGPPGTALCIERPELCAQLNLARTDRYNIRRIREFKFMHMPKLLFLGSLGPKVVSFVLQSSCERLAKVVCSTVLSNSHTFKSLLGAVQEMRAVKKQVHQSIASSSTLPMVPSHTAACTSGASPGGPLSSVIWRPGVGVPAAPQALLENCHLSRDSFWQQPVEAWGGVRAPPPAQSCQAGGQ